MGTTNRGWCFRDYNGRLINACIVWDPDLNSIIEVEALALKEVMHVAIQMQMKHVIFESDSQMMVQ